eukprot:gene8353-1490_t
MPGTCTVEALLGLAVGLACFVATRRKTLSFARIAVMGTVVVLQCRLVNTVITIERGHSSDQPWDLLVHVTLASPTSVARVHALLPIACFSLLVFVARLFADTLKVELHLRSTLVAQVAPGNELQPVGNPDASGEDSHDPSAAPTAESFRSETSAAEFTTAQ